MINGVKFLPIPKDQNLIRHIPLRLRILRHNIDFSPLRGIGLGDMEDFASRLFLVAARAGMQEGAVFDYGFVLSEIGEFRGRAHGKPLTARPRGCAEWIPAHREFISSR